MAILRSIDPLLAAAIALGLLWVGYRLVSGTARFWRVAVGVDGRYSSSRFQGLVWTIVVLFAYLAIFVARAHRGSIEPIHDIAPNVLTALGLSLGTTAAAAGITSSRVARRREVRSSDGAAAQGLAALVEDDTGRPDLAKGQLLAWTLVTLAVYLVSTVDAVSVTLTAAQGANLPGLPDIDTTLLVLSGIGQGAYLVNKVVAAPGVPAATTPAVAMDGSPATAGLPAIGAAPETAASTLPMTTRVGGFRPSVNGLHFINAFPHEATIEVDAPPFGKIPIGDASNGLCGGMVYTVRDVFQTSGMAPIPDPAQPPPQSSLFKYIVDRLIASFDLPHAGFLRYYEWMTTPDGDTGWPPFFVRRGLAWKTIVEEWPNRVRRELDAGRLCCLGLVTTASSNPTELGQNHQVLAYGYDLDAAGLLTLFIYDPNTPQAAADNVRISLSLTQPSQPTPITHNVGIGNPIRGFFMVDYAYRDPTALGAN